MSEPTKGQPEGKTHPTVPTEPIDVIDGIPDRSSRGARWKLLILLTVFALWVAVLVLIHALGSPQ